MRFSEMPYTRPDKESLRRQMTELTERLKKAPSFEEAEAVFLEKEKLNRGVDTLYNLSYIRHSIDTRDEFYDGESTFWDETAPELGEFDQAWKLAMLSSPFRPDFERKYGKKMFLDTEIAVRAFSPELIPLMQEENALRTRYEKLIASASIPFEGGTYTLSQLSPFKTDASDGRRLAAWKAEGAWYKEHQAELDEIYDRMVRLRDEMGRRMGYENFIPLGYDRMGRNCYSQKDVEAFREVVRTDLVPLADRIFRDQAKRLGVEYPLSFSDAALAFRSGNPRPVGDEAALVDAAQQFYSELSPLTGEFFSLMRKDELMSLSSTEGKSAGGYCTGLLDYGVPFVFANFNGTQGDVEVLTHEVGHAFAAYVNRDVIPSDNIWPSMEACEVHSMSMEFLAWPWEKLFFGADTDKFLYSHLAGAIKFIPYGTMVDHFQHEVYARPEMTPRERHGVWKKLLGEYMPWLRLDGEIPFYSDGEGWQRQLHIYQSPFYYIDYCLAQTVALEIWAIGTEDHEKAFETYMAYTRQGGTKVFTELLSGAALKSPFDPACLKEVCRTAKNWLDAFDASKLL
ncbi:MAG: M3 family oligoendopeptidase [Clostridia bacterium]|nr:M3 family oligoendopeptidase [Clostridia bacterium]